MKKHFSFFIVLIFTLTLFSSCGDKKGSSSSAANGTVTNPAGDTQAEGNPETTKAPSPSDNYDFNPLTGEYNIAKGSGSRPVGFMISNINLNKKQPGIHDADMYFDTETEGGISRLMVVFAGVDRVPDKIGPVRSARSPYITVANAFGAIYNHYGGEQYIRDRIKGTNISDIDGMTYPESVFKRDKAFKAPNNVVVGKAEMKKISDQKKFKTENAAKPFEFSSGGAGLTSTESGESLQVYISGAAKVSFKYNAESKKYVKHLGDLSNAVPHASYEGKNIETSTVAVIYAKRYSEGSGGVHTNFELKNGSGIILNGGKSVKMKWQLAADGFRFTDQSGNKLELPTGNIYMCLTGTNNEGKTVLK